MLSDLIKQLQAIYEESGDMEVHGVVGSSGTAYELGSAFLKTASKDSYVNGPLEDLEEGTKYVQVYMGN